MAQDNRSAHTLRPKDFLILTLAESINASGVTVFLSPVDLYGSGIARCSWIFPLYSVAAYAAGLKAMEFIAEGVDRSESARIITTRPGEVCAALSETCGCGIMGMDARGWYADSEKSVVYIVVNRFRIPRMRVLIHEEDPGACLSIAEVADVFRRSDG